MINQYNNNVFFKDYMGRLKPVRDLLIELPTLNDDSLKPTIMVSTMLNGFIFKT